MVGCCEWHYGLGKSFVPATFALLLLSIFTLLQQEAAEALVNSGVNTKGYNQNDLKGYVIKYSAEGGFTGRHDYAWYNSTTNHLLSNHKINTSLYDLRLSNALFDTQLSSAQQENLSKMITNGNFFNISFYNDKPACCDISYYNLEIKMGNTMNSVSWTSRNIGVDPNYEKLPPIIMKIVDTLGQYTANSTLIFSESRIKDKFEIKRDIIYEANLLLAQKNYSQAESLYDKALKIGPDDVDALVGKAHSLIGMGQLANATSLIDNALDIQPSDIYALIAKAIVLTEMGQVVQAIAWIDKALEVDPTNAKAIEMKNKILESMK